jgi:hypothetical protein
VAVGGLVVLLVGVPLACQLVGYRGLGCDKQSLAAWLAVVCTLVPFCAVYRPPPPAPALFEHQPININYVYNWNDNGPQEVMHPLLYLTILFVGWPVLVYFPTHLFLRRFFPQAPPLPREA